jgi:hypothetical protein
MRQERRVAAWCAEVTTLQQPLGASKAEQTMARLGLGVGEREERGGKGDEQWLHSVKDYYTAAQI